MSVRGIYKKINQQEKYLMNWRRLKTKRLKKKYFKKLIFEHSLNLYQIVIIEKYFPFKPTCRYRNISKKRVNKNIVRHMGILTNVCKKNIKKEN